MSARESILAAVREGLGNRKVDEDRVRKEAAALLGDLAAVRPALMAASTVDAFVARIDSPKVTASQERIRRVEDFPDAVRRYLDANKLPHELAMQPAAALAALDWAGVVTRPAPDASQRVGVGFARWGIAETGSIVFHSNAETPILANFLPLHHLVLIEARTIVPSLEDYVAAAQAAGETTPRNVNIITGASGTTDIEGTLVLGAHGPRYLHIVIADD